MKDNRFIELVNLYIDRQITAAETAELETEIQGNPRRRAIYHQYCKMHRATTLLYDSFRAQVAGPGASETPAQGSIALFESRQRVRRFRWAYYGSGLAAAACLALVMVRLNPRQDPAPTTVAAVPPPVTVAASQPEVVAQPASLPEATPVRVVVGPASLRNVSDQDFAALLAALRQQQRNSRVASDRVPSLFDDGVFEAPQVLLPPGQRVFRSEQAQTPAQQAEFTGYQFQR